MLPAKTSAPVLCACGCGQEVSIATHNRPDRGYLKGQPCRYARGHTRRSRGAKTLPPLRAYPQAETREGAIVAEIARRFGLVDHFIYRRTKAREVVSARFTAMWALREIGRSPAQIARLFGLDHTTVLHGLARAAAQPDWQAMAGPALNLMGAGGQRQTLVAWLDRELPADLTSADKGAVQAYATCTLLGWEQFPVTRCRHGMLLVLRYPVVRAALEEALRRSELSAHIERIRWHEARLYPGRAG